MIKIDLNEAIRRTEGMLVRQGYKAYGKWTDKFYDDGEKEPIWSTALTGVDNTRVLLWPEKDHWRAVVSVMVGMKGHFPVCEGLILRDNKDKFIPPLEKMALKIIEVQTIVGRWGFEGASKYSHIALARLTKWFLQNGMPRKAKATNEAIITGELNAATVSEALSIVQSKYASTRERRLESAVIWREVYR